MRNSVAYLLMDSRSGSILVSQCKGAVISNPGRVLETMEFIRLSHAEKTLSVGQYIRVFESEAIVCVSLLASREVLCSSLLFLSRLWQVGYLGNMQTLMLELSPSRGSTSRRIWSRTSPVWPSLPIEI